MPDTTDRVRAHYDGPGLLERIKTALAGIAPEGQPLSVSQLAMLDQFHTRGILATAELAGASRAEGRRYGARPWVRHRRPSALSRFDV